MEINRRFVANIFFLLGLVAVSKGRTLTPSPDPTPRDIGSKISLTTTPVIVHTTPLQAFTTVDMKTNSQPAIMAQNRKEDNTAKNNTTVPAAKGQDDPDKDGLPLWGYILIGIGAVIVLIICVIISYAKFVKWKDHGTYMVWDDAELETSPAFTRESEFLLETQTGGQENTPELQLYEIPLDSVTSHPRISYMGTKRVAPKKQEERRSSKDYRKKDGENPTPSLTKYTKRDTVYNSVTDTCITSVMSEGTLDGHGSTSSHTLATVMFSNGGLDKYGSTSHFNIVDSKQQDKSHTIGSRARSVSNLIQSRPLPAVPINKRFSKSLDKFRFFNTLPVIKTHATPRAGLLYGEPPYSNLVKSASYGSNLHRTVNNNICLPVMVDQPPLFATRKSSLDFHAKLPPNKFNHRKSKSLDTLTLLKGIDFNVTNVDIYHSYESVHNRDAEYASVSDSQPNSPTMSDCTPQHSPTKIKSPIYTNTDREGIYASLSHEDLQREVSQEGSNTDANNVGYDSSTLSSVSSDATSPYASVRISQIPGLSYDHCEHDEIYCTKTPENSGESFETMSPENSGSSAVELKPTANSARSSTHTYIELFPEQTNRDSVISETSSGYARPVDVINGTLKKNELHKSDANETSKRASLTDMEIPVGDKVTFDKTDSNREEVYDNPVNISDDTQDCGDTTQEGINLDDSVDDVHVNIRPLLKRSDSDHSECEI